MPRDTDRADRILDSAGELLLRHGYRKVTIDDIARQAGVGKGTVYLHWKTKTQLFQTLLLRESTVLVEDMLSALRADSAEVLPHRFVRLSYLASHRRPLVLALVTEDTEVLGNLRAEHQGGKLNALNQHFFDVLVDTGLLRDDITDLAYAMNAASLGFFLVDQYKPALDTLDREAKADALAQTVRCAFEPAGEPDPAAIRKAATEIEATCTELITRYRELIDSLDAARNPR